MSKKTDAPSTNEEFDKVYNSIIAPLMWSDIRIPKEIKDLVKTNQPINSLELGCGLGIFSNYMAKQKINATGVDFSSIAIEKAKVRSSKNVQKPRFIVGDVTNLENINEQFDVSFDVGCFHCLDIDGQQKYVSEIYRLLKPGETHLIWALDHSPSNIDLSPNYIAKIFENRFQLVKSEFSRRRLIASHWYWLIREK